MTSPTHHRERAAAATVSRMQNPVPAPALPLPLSVPHPHQQQLVGVDPFLEVQLTGLSHQIGRAHV